MSIRATTLVWQHYQRGGSEKLALLALADWCGDDGGNLYPSISAIAKKICVSESQARRIIHGFIDEGLLDVIGNHNGGSKSQTRQYRLNLEKLAATPSTDATPCMDDTPSTDATPCMDDTPSTDARHPLHGCASPLAPMLANTLLTVKEPLEAPAPSKEASEILNYLNERARRSYRPVKANVSLILARLKEGATPDDCRAVIDAKVAAWSTNPKMAQYLRPVTLFNATKFWQYTGELTSTPADGGFEWE